MAGLSGKVGGEDVSDEHLEMSLLNSFKVRVRPRGKQRRSGGKYLSGLLHFSI